MHLFVWYLPHPCPIYRQVTNLRKIPKLCYFVGCILLVWFVSLVPLRLTDTRTVYELLFFLFVCFSRPSDVFIGINAAVRPVSIYMCIVPVQAQRDLFSLHSLFSA